MSSTATDPGTSRRQPSNPLVHPLDEFYARSGLTLPPLDSVDGEAVPEPFRSLLVHEKDMTSTLENHHGRRLHLHVIGKRVSGDDGKK